VQKTGDPPYVNLLFFLLSFPFGAAGDIGEDDAFFKKIGADGVGFCKILCLFGGIVCPLLGKPN